MNVNKRTFSSNQEATGKDVKLFFGVVKGQFQILRRQIRSWELEDVVVIVNTFVILHNLIVRMTQNGDFRDEANGENLTTKFLEKD